MEWRVWKKAQQKHGWHADMHSGRRACARDDDWNNGMDTWRQPKCLLCCLALEVIQEQMWTVTSTLPSVDESNNHWRKSNCEIANWAQISRHELINWMGFQWILNFSQTTHPTILEECAMPQWVGSKVSKVHLEESWHEICGPGNKFPVTSCPTGCDSNEFWIFHKLHIQPS